MSGTADTTRMAAFATHGGRIDVAQSRYPEAPQPWLDLSTGVSPFAWPADGLAATGLRTLPSPAALAGLEQAAADAFGGDPARLVAVPGSESGLRLLAALPLPRPFRVVEPTYCTLGEIFADSEAIDPAALTDAADAGGTILLGNPNNPDGRILPPDLLLEVAARLRRSGGWLVIDEAFADVVDGSSVLPHLSGDEPVIVSRSFGKFFGLPGLRLGFLAAPDMMVAPLRHRLGGWPVSGAALAIGMAAYADRVWAVAMRTRLADHAAALDGVLARHGLAATGRCPLFRLVETPHGAGLFDRLAAAGILVRPFGDAPTWLRFGLPGNDARLARLDAALRDG